ARQETDEGPDSEQPRLVDEESDEPEGSDQAFGLLAELPAAVENRGSPEGLGRKKRIEVAARELAVAEAMERARPVGILVENVVRVREAERPIGVHRIELVAKGSHDLVSM